MRRKTLGFLSNPLQTTGCCETLLGNNHFGQRQKYQVDDEATFVKLKSKNESVYGNRVSTSFPGVLWLFFFETEKANFIDLIS